MPSIIRKVQIVQSNPVNLEGTCINVKLSTSKLACCELPLCSQHQSKLHPQSFWNDPLMDALMSECREPSGKTNHEQRHQQQTIQLITPIPQWFAVGICWNIQCVFLSCSKSLTPPAGQASAGPPSSGGNGHPSECSSNGQRACPWSESRPQTNRSFLHLSTPTMVARSSSPFLDPFKYIKKCCKFYPHLFLTLYVHQI